ncbi:hypothetical protein DXG01_016833 [Tephrocybe rancida]|nr:hypothetical protein DXG01_016833 [Tephrocybe rancida]
MTGRAEASSVFESARAIRQAKSYRREWVYFKQHRISGPKRNIRHEDFGLGPTQIHPPHVELAKDLDDPSIRFPISEGSAEKAAWNYVESTSPRSHCSPQEAQANVPDPMMQREIGVGRKVDISDVLLTPFVHPHEDDDIPISPSESTKKAKELPVFALVWETGFVLVFVDL